MNEKKKFCYLCNVELTSDNDHGEHIFQQALGGTLVCDGILCEQCGNKLGQDIDIPFIKIFKNYISRLPIKFDRKSNNTSFSEEGKIFIPKFDYIFKFRMNKKDLLPIKVEVFMKNDILFILYPKGMPDKDLKGLINKKMEQFKITDPDKVIVIRDFNDYLENIYTIPFNLENIPYKQGMAKIAIGFAVANGIKREELECVLDIDNHQIQQRIALLPYMPWDFVNGAIEEVRFGSNDFRYLSHQIKLFNLDKRLFSYVEIFGTFQCYILLSENYYGESINKSYMQPIFQLRREELKCLPRRYKDLLFYKHLLPEGKKLDYTERTLNNINTAIRKQPNELDLDEYYSDLLSSVINNWILFDSEQGKKLIKDDRLILFYENNLETINSNDNRIKLYYRFQFLSSNIQKIKTDCYWRELFLLQEKCKDKVFEYNSRKMRKLEDMIKFIQNNKEHFQVWDTEY